MSTDTIFWVGSLLFLGSQLAGTLLTSDSLRSSLALSLHLKPRECRGGSSSRSSQNRSHSFTTCVSSAKGIPSLDQFLVDPLIFHWSVNPISEVCTREHTLSSLIIQDS
ncbi:unnamed protein product [Clavelina lepadiformis]|uniref:Secreted protein n=1 Tax=Clavelina lepadiformis TaxID=159417 RepID=A0ABP0FXI6_CLALP